VFPKGYLTCIYRAWSLFPIVSMCPSTVHLADTRPHNPTTLANGSIIHTSLIGSTHAIYREADHALTCAYRLLSFPICQLGSHNITLLIAFFPDGALNPPSSSPPPYLRRHVFAGNAVSTSGHHFLFFQTPPAIHYHSSTTDDRRQDQATRRAYQAHAQCQQLATK